LGLYQKEVARKERSGGFKSNFTAVGCEVDSLIRLKRRATETAP
jgi:hypothetical protein